MKSEIIGRLVLFELKHMLFYHLGRRAWITESKVVG